MDPLVFRHMDMGSTDRLYDCLPMYHSVGGVQAPGAVLVGGGSVIIRDKFSARNSGAILSDGTARCVNISASCAVICCTLSLSARRHGHRIGWRAATAWAAIYGTNSRPFPNSSDPGVLCRHRRNVSLFQRRGRTRGHRPNSLVPRAPFPSDIIKFDVENDEPGSE